jgi:hypothetical protein
VGSVCISIFYLSLAENIKRDMLLEQFYLNVTLLNGEISLLELYDEIQDRYEYFELRRIVKWKEILVEASLKLFKKSDLKWD